MVNESIINSAFSKAVTRSAGNGNYSVLDQHKITSMLGNKYSNQTLSFLDEERLIHEISRYMKQQPKQQKIKGSNPFWR